MTGPARMLVRLLGCSLLAVVLAGCGSGDDGANPGPTGGSGTGASAGTAAAPGGPHFGTQPCGKLVSFEEIAAATGENPTVVEVVSDGECDYKDDAGFAVLSVLLDSDAAGNLSCTAQDGTYLGAPVERLSGIGDTAVWSPTAQSVCLVKGHNRVRISLSTPVDDAKATSEQLAAKAAQRLP